MAISLKTQKMLWGRAANRRAFPDCRRELVMDASETDDESLVGDACHIVAESTSGPRGDSPLTPEQRDEYDNLILLCKVHHKLIDDQPNTYTVQRLLEMKTAHEKWVRKSLQPASAIWNVPHPRNPNFTGREDLLADLHTALTSDRSAALTQAIHGLGGVGKTQLAVEYAYRHAADYDLVWWVRAEEPATLSADYAALATPLNLPQKDEPDQRIVVEAVCHWLTQHPRWLLVLDNAPGPAKVRDYIPQGATGHVLVTSRNPDWRAVASPLTVRVWPRAESLAFLLKRTGLTDEDAAGALAEELGDLPLALAQAGAYVEATGATLAGYLALFRDRRSDLWRDEHPPLDYPKTVATTWSLAMERVRQESPAAAGLLNLCAYLGPDDIPRDLLSAGAKHLPEPLAAAVTDSLALNRALAALRRYSLLERRSSRTCSAPTERETSFATPKSNGEALAVHRLVQAVARDRLAEEARKTWAAAALRLVNEAFPSGEDDPSDVRTWPVCARLLPHALAAAGHAENLHVAPEATGRLLNQAGLYLSGRAESTQAKAALKRALAICEGAYGPNHPNVAGVLNNLSGVFWDMQDLKEARTHLERVLAIDEAAYGPNHPNVASDVNNLGSVLQDLGDLDGARDHFQRALAIWEKQLGPDHPQVATGLNNLGSVLKALGDLDGARDHLQRALAIWEKQLGPEHPQVATAVNNLGSVLQDLGDLDGARDHFQRALAIDQAAFGPDHPTVAIRLNNLGLVLQDLGDLDGARDHFQRALAIWEKQLGLEHPQVATAVNNLGLVLHALGDLDGARDHFRRALAIFEKQLGPEHPQVATGLNNLGRVLQDLGDLDGARDHFRRALAILEAKLPPGHPNIEIVRRNLESVGG